MVLGSAHIWSKVSGEGTVEKRFSGRSGLAERRERAAGGPGTPEGAGEPRRSNGKGVPPEKTHAEEFYYQKQMAAHTPMVVVMADGEDIHGWVEWYDQDCIKVHRRNAPNLLIYKQHIKFIYKDPEEAPEG